MTEHPITPPPELVDEWVNTWNYAQVEDVNDYVFLATQAARWGADQELEACCEWLLGSAPWTVDPHECFEWVNVLRNCRRPKPLSLKQQSIALLDRIQGDKQAWQLDELDIIRRALEQLDD